MYRRKELIANEIQLAEDECCIVFDFGCYFPYSNSEILTFEFSLGEERFDDYKINHRYPNHRYQTISKKYGRKISKLGYPYVMKLDEQGPMLLSLKVGLKDQYITMVFPIQTHMTKDKPVCGLGLRYNFDESEFRFVSYEKMKDDGWHAHHWCSHEVEDGWGTNVVLSAPQILDDSFMAIYSDVIEPAPSALLDLFLQF